MTTNSRSVALLTLIVLGPLFSVIISIVIAQTALFGRSADPIAGITLIVMLSATVCSAVLCAIGGSHHWAIKLLATVLTIGTVALSLFVTLIGIGVYLLLSGNFSMEGIQ